jgi:hypothetical protein
MTSGLQAIASPGTKLVVRAPDTEVVMSCVCNEPKIGKIVRQVRPMPLSLDNLRIVWELSKKYDALFGEDISQDFARFIPLFVREGKNGLEAAALIWVVDDFVGLFYMTDIVPGIDAKTHYTFFDGRHKGREELTKGMIKFVFEKYNFVRLSTEVPLFVTDHVFKFVKLLGFRGEGRKRKARFFKSEWFDVITYGILREEVMGDG